MTQSIVSQSSFVFVLSLCMALLFIKEAFRVFGGVAAQPAQQLSIMRMSLCSRQGAEA